MKVKDIKKMIEEKIEIKRGVRDCFERNDNKEMVKCYNIEINLLLDILHDIEQDRKGVC